MSDEPTQGTGWHIETNQHGIKSLHIHCAMEVDDVLDLMPARGSIPGGEAAMELSAYSRTDEERIRTNHYVLDEPRVRALFNFLGIWLHGSNRP